MAFDHNDHYHPLLLRQVPSGAARLLPDARVRRLLFWRYLLVSRRP